MGLTSYGFNIGDCIHFTVQPPIPIKLSNVFNNIIFYIIFNNEDVIDNFNFRFRVDIMFGDIGGDFFMLPGNPFESESKINKMHKYRLIKEEITIPGEKIYGIKISRVPASSNEYPEKIYMETKNGYNN